MVFLAVVIVKLTRTTKTAPQSSGLIRHTFDTAAKNGYNWFVIVSTTNASTFAVKRSYKCLAKNK